MLDGGLTFRVEKMFMLPDGGKLRAFADVNVNGVLIIRGCRVLDGKNGLFFSLPQEQGKDNKWYDIIQCKTTNVFAMMSEEVLTHYRNEQVKKG